MDSDEELYSRVRSGDIAAFDVLYDRYAGRLYSFLRAQLASTNDAEDVFHEAFMRALKSPEVTFDRGGFRTWLYRVARNLALNHLRSGQRGARAHARLSEVTPDAPKGADAKLEEAELHLALDGAVARLPEALSEVYHLRTSGLSYEEMAQILEIPLGTLKSRMNQMTTQLREEMRPWTAR
jgi:RNA polymerase sigma-70 factor (ECF subfamily)